MNYKDQWAEDDEGNKFVFTVEMQRELDNAGYPPEPEYLEKLSNTPPKPIVNDDTQQTNSNGSSGRRTADKEYDPLSKHIPIEEKPVSIQIDPQTGKYIGRIKWYNVSKGYGFIYRGADEDIFFHKTDISCDTDEIDEGVWILYDVEETSKGLEANEVELYTEEA